MQAKISGASPIPHENPAEAENLKSEFGTNSVIITHQEIILKVHSPFCRPKIVISMNPIVY